MPQAPAETEQVCPRGSKSISGFPLGLGSVTPEAGVQGSPEGASSQGKRLRPTAVTEVAGGGGGVPASARTLPLRRRRRALWQTFCVCHSPASTPARCSAARVRGLTCPRVAGSVIVRVSSLIRQESGGPSTPALGISITTSGFRGGGTPQPAPLLSFTPLRQRPQVTGHVSAKGAASTSPRRHRSSWGRVHTAEGARDPPESGPARRPPRKTAAQRKR